MLLDCVRNVPLFVVSAVDFNANSAYNTINHVRTQYTYTQFTQKPYTLDTQETSSANDSLPLIISKQMRTNGKSCYHRYDKKKEHAYLWENESA